MRTFLIALLCSASAFAADPREAGDAPAFSLEEAISKAKSYAATKKLDLSRQYLQSADFDITASSPKSRGRCWTLTWQTPRAKGGTTFITLCEDGRSSHTFGE